MNPKTILLSLLLSSSFILVGCERDLVDNPTLSTEAKAPILHTSSTSIVLSKAEPSEAVFTWDNASFGENIPVSYSLRLSNPNLTDGKFTLPIAPGAKEHHLVLDDAFNTRLVNELKLPMGTPSKIKAELLASYLLETGSPTHPEKELVSEALELTVTPFSFMMRPPYFYLVGDINGKKVWDINSTDYIFFADENDTNILHYYGYFKEGAAFKLVPEGAVGDWNKVVGMKEGQLTSDGGDTDIKIIPASGIYHLTLTLNEGEFDPSKSTLLAEPFESETNYNAIGIVGDVALSWDEDTPLSNASADHIWVGRGITLKEGQFKIRADKAWDTSWGGDVEGTFPSDFGLATSTNSKNWTVTAETAGNYDIYFNDLTGNYIFVKL